MKKRRNFRTLDEESYKFCKIFRKKALIKISASEHDNTEMITDALKNFKKVFINISGFEIKKIKQMVAIFKNKKTNFYVWFSIFFIKSYRFKIKYYFKSKKMKLKLDMQTTH